MIYTQLSKEYKYDTLADAIFAREVEYFHYDFDRINFSYLLNVTTDEKSREDLNERYNSTVHQMKFVVNIMEALRAQIDDEVAYAEAVDRAVKKRALEKQEAKK